MKVKVLELDGILSHKDLFYNIVHNILYNMLLNAQLATLESEQFLIKDFYLVEVGDDSHHVAAAKY